MPHAKDNGKRRALIVGGSMAGLFTALFLHRHCWRVDVFERSSEKMASRGAGLACHPELANALSMIGIDPDTALAVSLAGRRLLDRAGHVIDSHPLPQRVTSWDLLYRCLRGALPGDCYHQGARFRDLDAVPGGIRATFEDGRRETGDLLIGADGVQSEVRERVLPEVRPTYAGYVAWRGMVAEAAVSETVRRSLAEHITFSLPPNEQTLSYPITGEGEGHEAKARRLNWVVVPAGTLGRGTGRAADRSRWPASRCLGPAAPDARRRDRDDARRRESPAAAAASGVD